jgi:soluble lytic murein transglycosylase-like protein
MNLHPPPPSPACSASTSAWLRGCVWAPRRAALLFMLTAGSALPAWATLHCTDSQGRAVIASTAAVAQLPGYRCAPAPAPAPAPTGTARAEAALGLGMPAAVQRAPGDAPGGLQWVATGAVALRLQAPGAASSDNTPGASTTSVARTAAAAQRLLPLISEAAQRYAHDVDLLKAIIHVESGFNAGAVSPKGAVGLMQLMPATARRMGVEGGQASLFDPHTNLQAGARYLRLLLDLFAGRMDLAVAAYNAGEGAVQRHHHQVPPFRETQAYVQRVLARYEHYKAE